MADLPSKYGYDIKSYPKDLHADTQIYGNNYAMFYINVSEDSKLHKKQMDGTLDIGNSRREQAKIVQETQNMDKLERAAYVSSPVAGYSYLAGNVLGFSPKTNKGKAALAGGAALMAYAINDNAATFTGTKRRIKSVIALHMPNNMNIRYSVNYEEKELLNDQAMAAVGRGTASLGKAAVSSVKNFDIASLKDSFSIDNLKQAGEIGAAIGLNLAPGTSLLQKLGGIAPNPKKEQLFRNVDVRSFQIDYQFFPRDPKEAQNVKDIIKTFKKHMHPEYKKEMQFLYIYPSEFDIVYYHGENENDAIHKHTSCVLTELSVNYTPQGKFNTFKDGTPTQINLFLTFKELVPLSAELIDEGL